MKIKSQILLDELIVLTQQNSSLVQKWKELPETLLNARNTEQSWSLLECIEHLNLYGNYYLPEIEHAIKSHRNTPDVVFKSGVLGNYFANSMKPKTRLNKMKTFKDKDPIGSQLNISTLDHFLQQQLTLLSLLEEARMNNLNTTKTGISISKWIRLKLGDTFRFVIYHNERHILQAANVLITIENL